MASVPIQTSGRGERVAPTSSGVTCGIDHQPIATIFEGAPTREASPVPDLSYDVTWLLTLIHERAFDPHVSVRSLRDAANARDHNVSSRFKRQIGLSVGNYIATMRVRAAAELLRTTSWSIGRIAAAVGYEYAQTFYRDVRKVLATTPGDIRRAAVDDQAACRRTVKMARD